MSLSSKVSSKVFIERIVIENFKSIRKLELRLKPGVNLLVGPNASGKTNILEAIYFLYRALAEKIDKTPYIPHIPQYWGPEDIIYNRDTSLKLRYEIWFKYYIHDERKNLVLEFKPRFAVKFTVSKSTILPVELELSFNNDTLLTFSSAGVRVSIRRDLVEEAKEVLKDKIRDMVEEARTEDEYLVMKYSNERLRKEPFLNLIRFYMHPFRLEMNHISEKKLMVSKVYSVVSAPQAILIIYRVREVGKDDFKGFNVGYGLPALFFWLDKVRHVLSSIMLLKHPDVGALRDPKPLAVSRRLDPRATNLAPVLYSLINMYGKMPERIEFVLSKLFPEVKLKPESKFGRVSLIALEGGLELPPPNIADGLLKLLAILTAIELKPSILLIDEIENSTHVGMLEYLIDELNSLEIPVIVATHSPIVVDLVGPERTFIVKRDSKLGTVIEEIRDVDKLRERLSELGVAFSDYVFYGKTKALT